MLKLTKAELAKLADAGAEISGVFDDLEALREKFAEEAANLISEAAEAIETARGIMDDAASAAEEYHDDKSDAWQEGERGQAYAEWRDRLRSVADAIAEDIEFPEVAEIERPDWVGEISDLDFAEFEF